MLVIDGLRNQLAGSHFGKVRRDRIRFGDHGKKLERTPYSVTQEGCDSVNGKVSIYSYHVLGCPKPNCRCNKDTDRMSEKLERLEHEADTS